MKTALKFLLIVAVAFGAGWLLDYLYIHFFAPKDGGTEAESGDVDDPGYTDLGGAEAATEGPAGGPAGGELKGMDRDEAIQAVFAAARGETGRYQDPDAVALMVVAHAALETGYFKHFVDSNIFGMTASAGQPYIEAKDSGDGILKFRAFTSIGEGIREYLALLERKYHGAIPAAESGDPAEYAAALKAEGYYSAPLADFTRGINSTHARCMGVLGG